MALGENEFDTPADLRRLEALAVMLPEVQPTQVPSVTGTETAVPYPGISREVTLPGDLLILV